MERGSRESERGRVKIEGEDKQKVRGRLSVIVAVERSKKGRIIS